MGSAEEVVVVVREQEEADLVEAVEALGPAADSPEAAVAGTRSEVRHRSVVRVVVEARRRDPQRRPLDPTPAREPVRGRMSVVEMLEREIVRTSVPVRDRVPPRCQPIGPVLEPDKELALARALRIDRVVEPALS